LPTHIRTSMDINTRNSRIIELLKYFSDATRVNKSQPLEEKLELEVEKLFGSNVWGFREILLVITIARLMDKNYRASTEFYKCNPRALYEGPIRKFLYDHHVPHRKSGPLNIAKATEGINTQWASQRRPSELAKSTVSLVKKIEKMDKGKLENFFINILARFFKESVRVSKLEVAIEPQEDPVFLFDVCRNMIQDAPDAGNTPQRIVGLLLKQYHDDFKSGVSVNGYEDRASVTSTTSKKPGDIMEEDGGMLLKVYEITVKSFGQPRVDESLDTIRQFEISSGIKIQEVFVICRKQDCHPDTKAHIESSIYLGKLEHENVVYYFVEIFEWIMQLLLHLTSGGRSNFCARLASYIAQPNTSEKVKIYWKGLLEDSGF